MSVTNVKLQSSDGNIVVVDQNVIKQMVTIQTMLENLGDDDTNNDEPIPIYAVNGETLDKVIEWTKYHIENNNVSNTWEDQFFKMNLEKIFQVEEAADFLEVNSLLVHGQVYIDNHFGLITATEGFKNLSLEKLGFLLARDALNVPNEEVVFESLVTWISADPQERSQESLEYLLPHIRASFLSARFTDENVKTFLEKHSNHELCHLLDYENKTARQGYDLCIVVLHEVRDLRSLKYLDGETWTHLTDIPKRYSRGGCKVCFVEDNIYLVGGAHGNRIVTEYNPHTITWRNMPILQKGSARASVCTLDNTIFVLAGNDTTCCMLDLSDDDPFWTDIAEMNSRHYGGGGAVVIERKIYVLGGDTLVEVYDVDQGI